MNFTHSQNPGYFDLAVDCYRTLLWVYRKEKMVGYSFPASFIRDFKLLYRAEISDYLSIILWAVIFTFVRYIFETCVCKPLSNFARIDSKSDRDKFPESLWKVFAYSCLWGYCSYLLIFSGKYDYFFNPYGIWADWHIGMHVPSDIKLLYFVECGFYLHSIYATLYMDHIRKDFLVMIVHHVLTITLISLSYACRYQKIGMLVIFVHDVTDIWLEFSKVNYYLKQRGGKFSLLNDVLSKVGLTGFAVSWFVFRLYWFPLKVLYTGWVVVSLTSECRLVILFNIMLWILLALNLYWFYMILVLLKRAVIGEELKDIRESTTDEAEESKELDQKKEN